MSRLRNLLTDYAQQRLSFSRSCLAFCIRLVCNLIAPAYWLGAQTKNWLYDLGIRKPAHLPVPIFSIGNLSVGGTGKSPAVRWLARRLSDGGRRVAVLSRGYKELESGTNDEALELQAALPEIQHFEAPNRHASGSRAIESGCEVLVLDDGFQHRRLARDCDIVLIDASEPSELHRVLPAGVFREPIGNIGRAEAVLLTHCNRTDPSTILRLTEKIHRYKQDLVVCQTQHAAQSIELRDGSKLDLSELRQLQVLAFCAIGKPASFFELLEELGTQLVATNTWPDHHHFGPEDVAALQAWQEEHQADLLLCTMKDWVKLKQLDTGQLPLGVLTMELEFLDGEEALLELVSQVLWRGNTDADAGN